MSVSRAVAEAMVEIGCVGFCAAAPVTFKSGIVSPVYCDNRRFPYFPAQWTTVVRSFETLIAREGLAFDVLGGIEAAGIPHSAALGFQMQRPSVFIRKEAKAHGTKKRVEGGDVRGRRVLLVEDLVSTGLSSLAGVEALRAEGAVVEDCLAIIRYEFAEARQAFAGAGVRLHTLTTFAEVLEVAVERGALTEADAEVVREWLSDPHGWSARRAGERR